MNFALPSALLLATFAVPIIVFYVLKVRLRRVPISTNLFWKQIYDEKPPRSIWQYLRHLLSLLIQLAILLLLVLAIADPFFPWQVLQARRIVAVIDNSASMRATDVKPSRFAAAVESATAFVDGLRFGDEMAIVLAGPRPEVEIGMSGHVPSLKRVLHEIKASDNPTRLSAAIELAKQLIGNHPYGMVVVFSDACAEIDHYGLQTERAPSENDASSANNMLAETATPTEVPNDAQDSNTAVLPPNVEFKTFATNAANVGITQFQVRRSLIDPLGYEVLVAVLNASDQDVRCRLELELDSVPVDILPLDLAPEERWSRALEKTSLEGGQLTAHLTQIERIQDERPEGSAGTELAQAANPPLVNALDVDDMAWAVLPPRKVQRVLIVTPGNLFLQKVFEANPLVQVEMSRAFPDRWPDETIVVLHRDLPEQLPAGNVLVVDPTGSCDAWELGDVLEDAIVTDLDQDSSLMTHVRLDNVLMPEARQLSFRQQPHVLAEAISGDALYAEARREKGKCLVLTVNLDRGDLAFRTAFPIMVTNALGWFAGTAGELRESLITGQTVQEEVDANTFSGPGTMILRSPTGREREVVWHTAEGAQQDGVGADSNASEAARKSSSPHSIALGPFDERGVWTVVLQESDQDEAAVLKLAVNLADVRESDLRRPEQYGDRARGKAFVAGWFSRPLWFYLAAAACVVTVVEWFMYQRRVIS